MVLVGVWVAIRYTACVDVYLYDTTDEVLDTWNGEGLVAVDGGKCFVLNRCIYTH